MEITKRERRRNDLNKRFDIFNQILAENAQTLFNEKLKELKLKEKTLLSTPDVQINQNLIDYVTAKRAFELDCANQLYKYSTQSAIEEYSNNKRNLKDKMINDINIVKKRLADERDLLEFQEESDGGARKGGASSRVASRRKAEGKSFTLPFLLKDHEILEDVSFIRKQRKLVTSAGK